MENLQHSQDFAERGVISRIDAALRINYQIISDDVALNDPYDPNFVLPRYFLLLAELDQFDHALNYELEQLSEKDQQIARMLSLFNQKLNLITGALYDSLVQSMLPIPSLVSFSDSTFIFYSTRELKEQSYIHLTLSHPENFFHIAATACVFQCLKVDEDKYKISAQFVTLLPQDRAKLVRTIEMAQQLKEL